VADLHQAKAEQLVEPHHHTIAAFEVFTAVITAKDQLQLASSA
jgi:hypothetical protein